MAGHVRRMVLIGAMLATVTGCGSAVSGLAGPGSGTVGNTSIAASPPAPSLGTGATPTVSTPEVSAPTVSTPAVSTPAVSTPAVPASTVGTPTRSRTTGGSSLTQDEFVAKLVGGDLASNLLWVLPETPADWTAMTSSEAGTQAWQLSGSRCRVILEQPDGMAGGSVRGSAALAADASNRLATANQSQSPQVVARTPVTFTVADVPGPVSVEFAGQQTHFADVAVTTMVWAYLSGDYALLAENVCPDADMTKWKASAGQFYRELKVRIEF